MEGYTKLERYHFKGSEFGRLTISGNNTIPTLRLASILGHTAYGENVDLGFYVSLCDCIHFMK